MILSKKSKILYSDGNNIFSIDAFKKTLMKIMLYAIYASCLWQDNEKKKRLIQETDSKAYLIH